MRKIHAYWPDFSVFSKVCTSYTKQSPITISLSFACSSGTTYAAGLFNEGLLLKRFVAGSNYFII